MSFNEALERDRALRAVTTDRYTIADAFRDLRALFSHVEEARQALERDLRGDGNTFGEGHRTAECDMCSRAAVWLPIINGSMR